MDHRRRGAAVNTVDASIITRASSQAPSRTKVDKAGISSYTQAENREGFFEHPLALEIARVCQTHWDSWGASTVGMELLEADDSLQIYRGRADQEGLGVDPYLAVHTLPGVTASEVADIFWGPQYRLEWENTLDAEPILLETLSSDTVLLHQIHRRVWLTDQRDSVFWSHIRRDRQRSMVVNHSTEVGAPSLQPGRQRMQLNVSLVCETQLPEGVQQAPIDRSNLRCRIQYSSQIHPGGWVPRAVLRQVARREYPKFVRRFTAYCVERLKHTPVQL